MSERALFLAMRHGALRERIAEQRRVLARQVMPVESLLASGDKALQGAEWLRQHPAAVGVAMAVLVVFRPKAAWRWAKRGIFVWRGWQALRGKLFGTR